jgi:hypothetical protein
MHENVKWKTNKVVELNDLYRAVSEQIRLLESPQQGGIVTSERLVKALPYVNNQLKEKAIELYKVELKKIEISLAEIFEIDIDTTI